MAAFAGIVSLDGEPVDPRQVEALAAAAPGLRGSTGVWAGDGVGLASAGDPAAPGARPAQPLADAPTGCVLVFDGRIDNPRELRTALAAPRQPEGEAADDRLVLDAYLAWGVEAPARLLGDFAFALWDPRTARLLLARDPIGVRTLYLSSQAGRVLFATTAEQLLTAPGVAGEVDDEAAVSYLYWPLLPLRRSYFRDLEPLRGGERAVIGRTGISIDAYWRWRDEPPERRRVDGTEVEELRALLAQAVSARLHAPGGVGLMLSGGRDSTSIAAVAGGLLGFGQLRTYSARFERFPSCDESAYIEEIVGRYGFAHRWIDGDGCWPFADLAGWLPTFTEPFFGPYDTVFHQGLALAQADGVGAMLTGWPGDTVLIGSPAYLGQWLWQGRWGDAHRELRALARSRGRNYLWQLGAQGVFPLLPGALKTSLQTRRLGLTMLESWMPDAVRRRLRAERRPLAFGGPTGWWRALRRELGTLGESAQHAYFDRMARPRGIEVRHPLADRRLIEFVLRTPPEAFYADGRERSLQLRALGGALPESVRARRDKTGLSPVLVYGLRQRRREFVLELLRDSELVRREYVKPHTWSAAMERYLAGEGRLPSWFALTLEIWLRHRVGRLPPIDDAPP